jgi:hypothetical protein
MRIALLPQCAPPPVSWKPDAQVAMMLSQQVD